MNEKTVLKDLILFSQIREMLSYYAFDACLVTCGTCKESLSKMKIQDIFDCDLMDTAFYLQRQGASAEGQESVLYHAPCHDSLDGKAATVLSKMLPGALTAVPHCCSEAGTLAISRPDIASAMRERKRDALDDAVKETGAKTILTNCPSCLQGLGRNAAVGAKPCHVAVALARRLVGEDWKNEFHQAISTAEVIAL